MNLVAIKDGKLLDPSLYSWNDETNEFSTKESNVYIVCSRSAMKINVQNNCKIFDLYDSELVCGYNCEIHSSYNLNIRAGGSCKFYKIQNSKINCLNNCLFLDVSNSDIIAGDYLKVDTSYNKINIKCNEYSTLKLINDNVVNCNGGNIICGDYNKINSDSWIRINCGYHNEIYTKFNSHISAKPNCKIKSGDKSIIHCGSESGIKCGNLSEIFVSNFQKNHVKIESIGKIFLTIDDERKEVEIDGEMMLIEKNLYKIEKIP